jgi:O-antigen/teichoic acid export membrane protein
MLGMLAISGNLLLTLVGEKWVDATIYLQLLCVVGIIYPLHPINLNIITALGRSDLFLRLEIIKKMLAIPIVVLGIMTSVKIMIIGMIFSSIISVFINCYYTKQMINYGIREQFSDVSRSLLVGIIMCIMVFILGLLLQEVEENYIVLVLQVFAGVVITIGLAHTLKMDEYVEFKELFYTKILSRLKR